MDHPARPESQYRLGELSEANAAPDPIEQFRRWFAEAAGLPEPTAMTLATVDAGGRPAARIVLLKGFDERGFVFFTNYESRKGRELDAVPRAALVFWWQPLERQVRIEGDVARVAESESDAYFATRPLGSRLGAWASPQSAVLTDRGELERRAADAAARFAQGPVPRPPHWGGFRVRPAVIEFWQGRPDRLHDRLRYTPEPSGAWRLERLGP